MADTNEHAPLYVADILSALSFALDLTEGQPMGHAVRTCTIATRIGRVLGISESEMRDLYFACLLKDAGCSSNSVRIHKIFGGDELISKRNVKLIDWSSNLESIKFAFANTARGGTFGMKIQTMIKALGPPRAIMDSVTKARCSRGAQIALQLGFGTSVANAIYALDEHWDGKGSPERVSGEDIPLLARIMCLSQTLEVLFQAFGLEEALAIVRKRTGAWFDPQVAFAAMSLESDSTLWQSISAQGRPTTLQLESEAPFQIATDADIDQICEAFASIIDAKSAFTGEHSSRVTEYSVQIATALNLGADQRRVIRRSALLHDIGKLGVPSSILEKPGALTDEEFAVVRKHPYYTDQILRHIVGFERIAEVASAHHERLDGRGYFQGLDAGKLDVEMRIIAAADVFDALSAKRPYRDALPLPKVMEIMRGEAGSALDPECVEALDQSTLVQEAA